MPEQVIGKLKKSVLPQWKMCFFAALIMGFIAHFYKITNWLPNWDSLVFRYDAQNMLALGRWFLPVVCAPSSFYDLPWISGLMSIIFHALGAVCICKIFDVQKNTTAVIIGALVATFPAVTSVMLYNYVADGYAIAFVFSCLAAMFAAKEKPNYIASVIMITLAVGTYQAYITVTIMLLLVYLIIELTQKKSDLMKLVKKSGCFLLTGIIGMGLYYFILMALLRITGTALLEYQGFDSAASFEGIKLGEAFYIIKNIFVNYFFDFSKGINVFAVTNVIVFAVILVLYFIDIIKNKLSLLKLIMLCICVILLPVGAGVLVFMNSEIDYHNLMKMGFLGYYLLFFLQYEKAEFKNNKLNLIKLWTILIVTVILIFNSVIIANVSYHNLNMAYQKSYGTLIRIVDRIEQTEGTENCDTVAILGYLPDSEVYSVNMPPDITGTTEGYILRADDETVSQSVVCSAINDYCGKNYKFVAGKEKEIISNKASSLDCWPAKDSIAVIDNVIVIKLGDER